MRPIAQLDGGAARGVSGVFTDIDDTLTHRGKLVPEAYRALCDAASAGLRVVAVTGRPGGWAEVLGVLWPVAAVVAENGGMAVLGDGERVYWDEEAVRAEQAPRLAALKADLLGTLPFARLALDQPLRRIDVAFDIGERCRLTPSQIEQIVARIAAHGARSLVSTVHAHAFYGDHDKAKMLVRLAGRLWGEDAETARARYLFVGDSPNDQAGFAFFPLSVGVANVARFADRLAPPPAWITRAESGLGFAELIATLLALRGS
ncbi:MAG: HAD family phosphatase [Myxococcales bacterium]|nr:HAD family phosphatase [Myxococcales bacterium]